MSYSAKVVLIDRSLIGNRPTFFAFEAADWHEITPQAIREQYGAQYRGGHLPELDKLELVSLVVIKVE